MPLQLRPQVARIPRVGDDRAAAAALPPRELARQEHVARLGLPVVGALVGVRDGGARAVERDAVGGRGQVDGDRGRPGDADGAGGGDRGGLAEEREELLRQEVVAEDVGGELQLVALRGAGAGGRRHDAGVVGEDVEAGFAREEGGRGGLDGGQVGEVDAQELEAPLRGREGGADGVDGGGGFGGRAPRDVDGAVVRIEDAGQVEADAGVAAGDDEDAASLVGEVLFGEGGRREAEGLAGEGAECGHFKERAGIGSLEVGGDVTSLCLRGGIILLPVQLGKPRVHAHWRTLRRLSTFQKLYHRDHI